MEITPIESIKKISQPKDIFRKLPEKVIIDFLLLNIYVNVLY